MNATLTAATPCAVCTEPLGAVYQDSTAGAVHPTCNPDTETEK